MAFAQTKRYRQCCFALDPAHDLRNPLAGEGVIFAGLHHDGAVSESFGQAGAVENFFSCHAIAEQVLIAPSQSAIHALPHAVAGDFYQAAQMYSVSDTLLADFVSPLVQLRESCGVALAED